MSLNYYQIFNDSADAKVFIYTSGSVSPGSTFTLNITGNSSSIIESYIEPYNMELGISEQQFLSDSFYPSTPGNAWLWNDGNKVKYIKIHHQSANNQSIAPYINTTNIISFYLDGATNSLGNYLHGENVQEVEDYALDNSDAFPQSYNLLVVDQTNPITSTAVASTNADNINYNFFASGSYTWYATSSGKIEEPVISSGFSSSLAQGFFPKNLEDFGDEQFFRGWTNANYYVQGNLIETTGFLDDNLLQFNTGSTERDYDTNNPYQHSILPFFINAPYSLELIQSESFSTYNTQNRIVQIGPRFIYSASISNYGDDTFDGVGVYDGVDETGELIYYYKEDTNEILVSDPDGIINNPKSETVLYEAINNHKLISLNNAQTYTTEEGSDIIIGADNELWLYRGNQPIGTGDVNAWNYNRYLHRPYKIYLVTQLGSNGVSQNIKEAHIAFSSSLANDRPLDGAYVFNSSLNQNVELTASVTLTSSHYGSGYDLATYDSSDEYDELNPPLSLVTWETASLRLYQGNINNNGFVLASSSIYINDVNIDNKLLLSHSITSNAINIGDTFRLALFVDTSSQSTPINSALIATEYDMKISASIPDASDLVPTYLDNILQIPDDCNPSLGNVVTSTPNNLLMDVDYSSEYSGSLSPINFNQIIDRTATKATVPEWNYTSGGIISGKYIGKQIQSDRYNIYSSGDRMPLGKVATIDYKNAYIGFFSKIIDPYPVLNGKTAYLVKYLIDDQGNLLDPALSDANYHNLLGVFTPNEERIGNNNDPKPSRASGIANNTGNSNELVELENLSDVFKVGYYPTPILYSQTSSTDYIGNAIGGIGIPLTGSSYLQSLSDYSDYAFTIAGNIPNSQSTEIKRGYQFITDNFPMPSNVIYQGPSATASFFSEEAAHTENFSGTPYMYFSDISSTSSGTGGEGDWNGNPPTSSGGDLSDNYIPSIDYTFYTTGLPDRKTYSWLGGTDVHQDDFGDIFFYLQKDDNSSFSSPTNMTIQVDSVELDWMGNIGINMDNPNIVPISQLSTPTTHVWNYPGNNSPFQISFHRDITHSYVTQAGVDFNHAKSMPGNYDGNHVGTSKYRWRVKLSLKEGISGNKITQKDFIRWKVEGEIKHTMKHDDHYDGRKRGFFPDVPNGDSNNGNAIVTMKVVGDNTQAASTTNNAVPDYWIFSGSSRDTLLCSSSILNQTYGQNYYQGDLIYNGSDNGSQPTESIGGGLNPDFPYNREPLFIQMGSIKNPWEIFPGDEIRFENKESNAREITQIFPPAESGDTINNYPALKIKLNEELNGNTDLNHFIIRRYDEAKNIVIIDQPKPYGIPVSSSSSPGILKPEFVIDKLDKNPEEIFDELIDKKILD